MGDTERKAIDDAVNTITRAIKTDKTFGAYTARTPSSSTRWRS